MGRVRSFGGIPGDVQTYGFGAVDSDGSVYVAVNPAQDTAKIELPLLTRGQKPLRGGRLLFRDAGFVPRLAKGTIELGPGQMALVGFGKYADTSYDFGIQNDMIIPFAIRPVPADFKVIGKGIIQAVIAAPAGVDLRLMMQQQSPDGGLHRTAPPSGVTMGKIFLLKAEQGGRQIPVRENYDREVWSGLSWAVGEISHKDLQPEAPLTLTLQSMEKIPVALKGRIYALHY